MSDEESGATPCFAIPLPGGKVARVPAEVLRRYVEDGAAAVHVSVADRATGDAQDVTAHDLKIDPNTGVSEFHTDWELGDCHYDDGSGTTQPIVAWHRHPFGTEYSEVYEY